MKRRTFLGVAVGLGFMPALPIRAEETAPVLGHGEFRYRVVPGWGVLDDNTPVKNCHGIVEDAQGHIILLTDHTNNNVIIYDAQGRLVHKWGTSFPGAHGLTIVTEGQRQVLFITERDLHKVYKTTLEGEVLAEWGWPAESGKYEVERQYKPAWTLHAPDGRFFVLDGYGRDYIQHFDAEGKLQRIFGGQEGGITHWGPHGGIYDDHGLLIAMSDQQYLLKLNDAGEEQFRVALPGGNPRQIQRVGDHYFVAHLADNWPADRDSRGFVSILDANFRVVSNPGGSAPMYNDSDELARMSSVGQTFIHPHDLVVARDGSLYIAQFMSNQTYPIKLERV